MLLPLNETLFYCMTTCNYIIDQGPPRGGGGQNHFQGGKLLTTIIASRNKFAVYSDI